MLTSYLMMVTVEEEVMVFCRLTAAYGGRASQGEGPSYRNIFVY